MANQPALKDSEMIPTEQGAEGVMEERGTEREVMSKKDMIGEVREMVVRQQEEVGKSEL